MNIDSVQFANRVMESPFRWFFWNVQRNVLNDPLYIPTIQDLKAEADRYTARIAELNLEYEAGSFDCDAYAFLLKGMIVLQAWKKEELRSPWTVGFVLARSPSGHSFNVALVRDRNDLAWVWIEPQLGTIKPAATCPWKDLWLGLF